MWVVLCLLLITAFVNSVVIVLFFVLKSFDGMLLAVLLTYLLLYYVCWFGVALVGFCFVMFGAGFTVSIMASSLRYFVVVWLCVSWMHTLLIWWFRALAPLLFSGLGFALFCLWVWVF